MIFSRLSLFIHTLKPPKNYISLPLRLPSECSSLPRGKKVFSSPFKVTCLPPFIGLGNDAWMVFPSSRLLVLGLTFSRFLRIASRLVDDRSRLLTSSSQLVILCPNFLCFRSTFNLLPSSPSYFALPRDFFHVNFLNSYSLSPKVVLFLGC